MEIRGLHGWAQLLESYPTKALVHMAGRLGMGDYEQRRKDHLVNDLAVAHAKGRRALERLAACDEVERLALRIALDGADDGLPGEVLAAELKDRAGKRARGAVESLLQVGLLLFNTERRPAWGAIAEALGRPDGWHRWRLVTHPAVRAAVQQVPLAGEPSEWTHLEEPSVGEVELLHSGSGARTIQALAATCAIIDRAPTPFTQTGYLRAAVERQLEKTDFPAEDTLSFPAWLALAVALALVDSAPAATRFVRRSDAHRLDTEPLLVLAALPAALRSADPALFTQTGTPWAASGDGLRFGLGYGYGFGGLGPAMADVVLDQLLHGTSAFLDEGLWFLDREFHPTLHGHTRRWQASVRSGTGDHWALRSLEPSAVRAAAAAFAAHLFDILAIVGALDRGYVRRTGERASRLTRLGAWLFRDPSRPGAPALVSGARWTDDGRVAPDDPADAPLLSLVLGSLGRAAADGPSAGFHVDAATLSATIVAGASSESVERRLRRLVPDAPLPRRVSEALAETVEAHRPVVLHDQLTAMQFSDLTPAERAALEAEGYIVLDTPEPLVLVAPRRVVPFLRRFGVTTTAGIDYDARPLSVCQIDGATGEMTIPRGKRSDLRLLGVLEDLGVPVPPAAKVTLAFDAIPGVDGLEEGALERHLAGLLRRLETHVDGPVPDGLRLQLLADGGLVDAPEAEKALLLAFPLPVARGLAERGALGSQVETLAGGRFVVPLSAVADVEARLSALGIPFPAEHSSLRERAQALLAVGALQGAVAELAARPSAAPPAAEAAPPAAARSAARASAPAAAAPTRGPEERVRAAVAAACRDGGSGLRLGEIETETGLDRRAVKALLRPLLEAGTVTLRGHARGARYSTT